MLPAELPIPVDARSTAPDAVVSAFLQGLPADIPVLMVFGGGEAPQPLFDALREAFPDTAILGCSSMAELGPSGIHRGGVSALGFPGAKISARVVSPRDWLATSGASLLADFSADLGPLEPQRHLLLTLRDGVADHAPMAQFATGSPLTLVGAASADRLTFANTWVAWDGRVHPGQTLVAAIELGCAFEAFATHHFEPTATRVVVTGCQPERRLVTELDGFPARKVLSRLLGVPETAYRDAFLNYFGTRPVVFGFRAANTFYLRGVNDVVDEGLVLGAPVPEGLALRWMRPTDLASVTAKALAPLLAKPHCRLLLFQCGGRHLEHGSQELAGVPGAGFVTYGEQLGPMRLTNTLSGVAFHA